MIKKTLRKDVAKNAGVSKAVITWVMSGTAKDHKISDATIRKVEKVIKKMNYRPSIWGRLINTQKSGMIAFISSDLSDPNTGEIVKRVTQSVRKRGYALMLFDLYSTGRFTKEKLIAFEDCLAEAYILHVPTDDLLEFCSDGRFAEKSFCVLGRNMENNSIPSVEVDNVRGAEIALEILFKKKIVNLGVVADLKTRQYTKERLNGCKKFLKSTKGVTTDFYYRKSSESQYETGVNAMKKWISNGKTHNLSQKRRKTTEKYVIKQWEDIFLIENPIQKSARN